MANNFEFNATVWKRTNGAETGGWHFISLPMQIAQEIDTISSQKPRKGRGGVKVKVRIGFVTWETSIFPDKKRGSYLLPLKAEIRKQLGIKENMEVYVWIELI